MPEAITFATKPQLALAMIERAIQAEVPFAWMTAVSIYGVGEIELTLRGRTATATTGQTVNVPANAPHRFRNASDRPARLLCTVAPAGLEAFFGAFADRVASRTAPAPELTPEERGARMRRAAELAPRHGIDNL